MNFLQLRPRVAAAALAALLVTGSPTEAQHYATPAGYPAHVTPGAFGHPKVAAPSRRSVVSNSLAGLHKNANLPSAAVLRGRRRGRGMGGMGMGGFR